MGSGKRNRNHRSELTRRTERGRSMSTMKQFAVVLLFFSGLTAFAFGRKKEAIQYAPLPAKVLTAKTIYIQNQTPYQAFTDVAYTELKDWGRYKVVTTKQQADLILVISQANAYSVGRSTGYVSIFNPKTLTTSGGTVSGGTYTITWTYTQLRLIDPATGETLWTDQKLLLRKNRKHSATRWLIRELAWRVHEQETPASQR